MRIPKLARPLSIFGGAALAFTTLSLAPSLASPAFASSPNPWPAHVVAPYVDTGILNTTLTDVASSTGDKFFTLAFVGVSGCQWSFPNESSWSTQIDNLRGAGGDVSISFGGYTNDTNGTTLGSTCSSPSAAAGTIENLVGTYNLSHIDFDIESNEINNSSDVNLTNQALAQVRSWAVSTGRSLSISYTLPVLTSGLTSAGQSVLTNGRSNGFTPDVVNLMAMDYGTSGTEMGTAAEQAVDAAVPQIASAYGISTSAAYAMAGVTPMIGQNDSSGEVFSLSDASTVESYASSHDLALVSFWSEGRDNGGCPGQTTASSTCSGISQSTYQFAGIFEAFAGSSGGGSGGGGGSTGPVVGVAGLCLDDWAASTTPGNEIDLYTCNGTGAQSWTWNGTTLQALGGCLDVWGAGTTAGTKVDWYTCNGTVAQVWQHQGNGALVNPNSGLCLDDPSSNTTPGAVQLQIWTCNGTPAQQWALPGVPGQITGIAGLCLDDWSSSTSPGNKIDVYTCNGTGAQSWTVTSAHTLQVLGGCLDVWGAGTTAGTVVDWYTCNGTVAQVWIHEPDGELVNPNSNMCLDDPGSNTTPGAVQLQIWTCNDNSNQQWVLP